MFPVADDFAAIAKRLKEIQEELAAQAEAADARRRSKDEGEAASQTVTEDACA